MQTFPYGRFLLYGFLSYATIFMLWSLLAAYGMSAGRGAQLISYLVTIIVIIVATRALSIQHLRAVVLCGVGWMVLHALLDVLYVVPTAGFGPFFTSYVWIEYAIVASTPTTTLFYMWLLKKSEALN